MTSIPEQINQAIVDYFAECEAKGETPNPTGITFAICILLKKLGLF